MYYKKFYLVSFNNKKTIKVNLALQNTKLYPIKELSNVLLIERRNSSVKPNSIPKNISRRLSTKPLELDIKNILHERNEPKKGTFNTTSKKINAEYGF